MKAGDTVRVTALGEFAGWTGTIVSISRKRATNNIGVRIPNHPWSKPAETVWWFGRRELDAPVHFREDAREVPGL